MIKNTFSKMKSSTEKKQSDIDKLFQQHDYSAYQIIKTQLTYFFREREIAQVRKELLKRPQWILSQVIPLIDGPGVRRPVKGYLVKQGRAKKDFVGGLIYNPEITTEQLKAISLSMHLQARLAEIPFEPLLIGIKGRKEVLAPEAESQIRSYLQKAALSPPNSAENYWRGPAVSRDNDSNCRYSFLARCFSEILKELKEIKFQNRRELRIAASNPDPFTDRVFELLPEEVFEVLSFGKDNREPVDILILSDANPLTVPGARKVRTNVVVGGLERAIAPEVRTVFAERKIAVIPNLITTLPKIVKPYFNRQGRDKFRITDENDLESDGARLTKKAFRDSWKLARRESLSLTSAAFALAIDRSTKIQSHFSPFR